ncbi:hypothetical protein PAECIP111892_03773 [Paenibacillus auburnensis]|uniref:Uncharacterized protein n=1 Tax=Paenibacillus auburnensis TaxID=2905649 RepID=A0ABN8GMD9_9BACL|nr:hypothetical protein PAECIP111892_03773 [Paenibacillus auburnensis]
MDFAIQTILTVQSTIESLRVALWPFSTVQSAIKFGIVSESAVRKLSLREWRRRNSLSAVQAAAAGFADDQGGLNDKGAAF